MAVDAVGTGDHHVLVGHGFRQGAPSGEGVAHLGHVIGDHAQRRAVVHILDDLVAVIGKVAAGDLVGDLVAVDAGGRADDHIRVGHGRGQGLIPRTQSVTLRCGVARLVTGAQVGAVVHVLILRDFFAIYLVNDVVLVHRPAAGEGYVLVGHGEGAVGHLGVGRGPAVEGIAGDGGGSGYFNRIIHGALCVLGDGGSVIGDNIAGVRIGDVELNLLPHGVEGIGALVIHDDGSVGQIFRFGSSTIGGPAEELVAGTGEAKFLIALQGDGFVVQGVLRQGLSVAAVGMVDQGRGGGGFAPDGVEGDVGDMDGNLVAGLIDGAAAYLGTPTQEHLALGGSQVGSGHDIGIGTVGIVFLVLRDITRTAVGVISDFEGLVAGVVGIEGNIAENPGVKVKGDVVALFILGGPASPGVALGNSDLREVVLIDLGAVGDGKFFRPTGARHGQVRSTDVGRRSPLGVDGDILGRHGAGELILLALPQLIIVPAHEGVLRRNFGRTGGGVGHIGDVCLILPCKRLFYGTVVNKLDLVAVTVIVETDRIAIVAITFELGTVRQIIGICKAGNRIVILF